MEGHHYNVGCCFAYYSDSIASKQRGALCGGSYMTKLVKNLEIFNRLRNLTVTAKMVPLNLDMLKNIQMVRKVGGRYVLVG